MINKIIELIDKVLPGQKTYLMLLLGVGMCVCQAMGYHIFSKEEWGMWGGPTALFWKMNLDKK